MFPLYNDYMWKEGRPYGLSKVTHPHVDEKYYRIVGDPYNKWISIEIYKGSVFKEILYDSRFLDFRKLKPSDQIGWRKEMIDAENAWIYNEDDRLILKERSYNRQNLCCRIEIYSPYATLIGYYEMPEGPLGALTTLFDGNDHCVMTRSYDFKKKKFLENW
jgi:hypothetical protein